MRWPIRNQILTPFIAIQCTTLAIVAIASAWIAVEQAEAELNHRLSNVMGTLEVSTFPLTSRVLDQLRPLSGAEFAVLNEQNQLLLSTLPGISADLTNAARDDWGDLNNVNVSRRSIVTVRQERYFAGRVTLKGRTGAGSVVVLYPEENWKLARWQALYPPLTLGGSVLILTILASIWIAGRIGNRIHYLQNQVSRIAEGNFEPIELSPLDDELKDLSHNVNSMCMALKSSWMQIRESERSVLVTQIVGGIAHHLRNAITGARISLQLHRGRCQTGNDEAIAVSLKQLTLMEEQIKGLLRLTRGESRTPFPEDVAKILDEIISLVQPICLHKKIDFTFSGLDSSARIPDGDALRAALLNLVMNGIDAAGPHGAVQVDAADERDRIVIDVRDNGPGIPSELEKQIFQPFFSTKPKGIGLGLALAQQAAQDCRGTLELEQRDGWTIFRLTLRPESANDRGVTAEPARSLEASR